MLDFLCWFLSVLFHRCLYGSRLTSLGRPRGSPAQYYKLSHLATKYWVTTFYSLFHYKLPLILTYLLDYVGFSLLIFKRAVSSMSLRKSSHVTRPTPGIPGPIMFLSFCAWPPLAYTYSLYESLFLSFSKHKQTVTALDKFFIKHTLSYFLTWDSLSFCWFLLPPTLDRWLQQNGPYRRFSARDLLTDWLALFYHNLSTIFEREFPCKYMKSNENWIKTTRYTGGELEQPNGEHLLLCLVFISPAICRLLIGQRENIFKIWFSMELIICNISNP